MRGCCTQDGNRTRTCLSANRILSPARLPVPPPGYQKKIHPVNTGWILSGRPGSNRPPQPWQGCALPNELLPLLKNFQSTCFDWDCKDKCLYKPTKFFSIFYLYFGVYKVFSGTFTSGLPLYLCLYKL
jgi:hypothetical protein